jgi:hypothetical protein
MKGTLSGDGGDRRLLNRQFARKNAPRNRISTAMAISDTSISIIAVETLPLHGAKKVAHRLTPLRS